MIFLVNRNAASRVECLHALAKHIATDSRLSSGFSSTQDIKVKDSGARITDCCSLLKADPALGIAYCPYKKNALDRGVCQLTNSVAEDTTKSKESSNSLNSLVALGLLIKNVDGRYVLSKAGQDFARSSVGDSSFTDVMYRGVTNYGPTVGLLVQLMLKPALQKTPGDAIVGYPNTPERVAIGSRSVALLVGSQQDSNTRTRTVLLKWLVAAGCIEPLDQVGGGGGPAAAYREFLNASHRRSTAFRVTAEAKKFLEEVPTVIRPLDYMNTIKTLSLRERNQATERNAILEFASVIRNRRTLIALLLNSAAVRNRPLEIKSVLKVMDSRPHDFYVQGNRSEQVIASEIQTAFSIGIPYSRNSDGGFVPKTRIDTSVLLSTAEIETQKTLESCL